MTLFSMDKLARAEAVVEAYVSANRGRSPDHPAYLMHLLWAESRRSGNFKWALIRVACRLVAFIQRQANVDDPEWLTVDQSYKVIEGLKSWRKRVEQQRSQAL